MSRRLGPKHTRISVLVFNSLFTALARLQVINLVKPIASVKKLVVTQNIASDVPELVCGDDKRLMQTALNVVGNAVKFTKEGSVTMTVCLERPELERDPNTPDFHPVNSTEYIYIRVQVRGSLPGSLHRARFVGFSKRFRDGVGNGCKKSLRFMPNGEGRGSASDQMSQSCVLIGNVVAESFLKMTPL